MATENFDIERYRAYLMTWTLHTLERERSAVSAELQDTNSELELFTQRNCSVILNANNSADDAVKALQEVDMQLQEWQETDPMMDKIFNDYTNNATRLRERQKHIQLLVGQSSTVTDLLSMPSKMDAAIRSGMHDEALELYNTCNEFYRRHRSPLIEQLLKEMESLKEVMHKQLSEYLSEKLTISASLKYVGLLRRLNMPQTQDVVLRARFLKMRALYMNSLIAGLSTTMPYEYLTKYLDTIRVQLFEIVTQYRAVFVDEELYELSKWANLQVREVLLTLETHLPNIKEGNYIANLLEQSMYCASSLGRVGLDFRSLLVPIFENSIIEQYRQGLQESQTMFSQALQSYDWFLPKDSLLKMGIPPQQPIMEYPPLAILLNSIIESLNRLRYCAPICLKQMIGSLFENSLMECANMLVQLETFVDDNEFDLSLDESIAKNSATNSNAGHSGSISSLARFFMMLLLPNVQQLLQSVFQSDCVLFSVDRLKNTLAPLYEPVEPLSPASSSTSDRV